MTAEVSRNLELLGRTLGAIRCLKRELQVWTALEDSFSESDPKLATAYREIKQDVTRILESRNL